MITVNGHVYSGNAKSLKELSGQYSDCDVVIYNGYQTNDDHPLSDGDTIVFIRRGEIPPQESLESMLSARCTPEIYEKVHNGKVAVAGLGGLGSHIAAALARTGVGALLLVDFDVVEPSNLNRQHYSISHLSQYKTDALKSQIADINPYVKVYTKNVRVDESNACKVFNGFHIICEAFDNPSAKAALVNALLQQGDVKIIASSGMAGYASSNNITTRRRIKNLYVCGDGVSEACPNQGLMAPRVMVCAGHQANMALRILIGIEDA